MSAKTILQLVLIDETGDSYYRMRWPGKELAAQNPDWRIINLDARAKERFTWARAADLLVLYQSNDYDLLPILAERKAQGLPTLVEYNDNFYESPAWGPVAQEWSSPLLWQVYEYFMRESAGVLVTGAGLKNLFNQVVPQEKLYILGNQLPQQFAPVNKIPLTQQLIVGWAGSLGHMADLLAIAPTIKNLGAEIPQLTFHVMGNESIPSLLNYPLGRLAYTPWGTMAQYYNFWKPVHIGIAPLLDTAYNRCRSDIKAVEIAALSALPLLPDALPYQDFLAATGLKPFTSLTDLKQRIQHYAANPQQLQEEAQRCYHYVQQQRLGEKSSDRSELYGKFLAAVPQPSPSQQSFQWPLPTGYHEVWGERSEQPLWQQQLAAVQELLNTKHFPEAQQKLQEICQQQPANADLALAYGKLLLHAKQPAAPRFLDKCCSDFPRDLRFHFLRLKSESDPILKKTKWAVLFKLLKESNQLARHFFSTDIIRLLAQQLQAGEDLLAEGEQCLEFFPSAAELRLVVAERYLKKEADDQALPHFLWLEESLQQYKQNQEFLGKIQGGYLKAWKEALLARRS